jgi:hypothetical protein
MIDKIVVLGDGAAAWAMSPTPNSDSNYTDIQGTDRSNHPADQFSDDVGRPRRRTLARPGQREA